MKDLLSLMNTKEMIKAVMFGINDALNKYGRLKVVPGKPEIKQKQDNTNLSAIGIVRLESKDFAVEVFMGFSEILFKEIYENIFQTTPMEVSSENHDLAGEILNVAFGTIDPMLRAQGIFARCSFPKIYSGEGMKKSLSTLNVPCVSIPYTKNGTSISVDLYPSSSIKENWTFDVQLKTA